VCPGSEPDLERSRQYVSMKEIAQVITSERLERVVPFRRVALFAIMIPPLDRPLWAFCGDEVGVWDGGVGLGWVIGA
jgi:hypothetical protein